VNPERCSLVSNRPLTEERVTMSAVTKTVTDATFDADVLGSDVPVLVDFWAEWCGPCKMVAPVLEEIAAEHADKITIAKVNIDENPEIARRYQIMSIPTMSVFSSGEVVKNIVGAKPKAALLRDLEGYL
jgi:thioredoxin 1